MKGKRVLLGYLGYNPERVSSVLSLGSSAIRGVECICCPLRMGECGNFRELLLGRTQGPRLPMY